MIDTVTVLLDLGIIFLLIVVNGFFAAAEIAVVISRRRELEQLEKAGWKGARIVTEWLKNPTFFLATVQIGITLVGVVASAVGGAAAIEIIEPSLKSRGISPTFSEPLALAIVVLPITALTLIFGELAPKSLALAHRERLASLVAPPIALLAAATRPLVRLLAAASRLALVPFGVRKIPEESAITRDEILYRLHATDSEFDATERTMIPRVMVFSGLTVENVMLPANKIVSVSEDIALDELLRVASEEKYTRIPVWRGAPIHITGLIHIKDIIALTAHSELIVVRDLVRPIQRVPPGTPARDLLALFQSRHLHMAVVVDSFDQTIGLVTLEDLIERIVGAIEDEHDTAAGPKSYQSHSPTSDR